MATRLLLVRHGQIHANVDGVWHGSTDAELTERGQQEARLVAMHIARVRPDVAAVYTSPLRRARHGGAIARSAWPSSCETVAEYGIEAEGETFAVGARHRFFEQSLDDLDWAPPGGQSSVPSAGASSPRGTASPTAIRPTRCRREPRRDRGRALVLLKDDPRGWSDYRLRNTSITEIIVAPPEILAFDLVDHLPDDEAAAGPRRHRQLCWCSGRTSRP